jgi:hypothetical protein
MPYFKPLIIRGQSYDLVHLNPIKLVVDSEQAKRALHVHARFTTHCFTEGFNPEVHAPDEPWIQDEGQRRRAFCAVRYGLSAHLPVAIHSLNHAKTKVYQTDARRNWLHSVTVEGQNGPYHIFFEVRRPPPDRRHLQDIELTVESAYPQRPGYPSPNTVGRMGFPLVIGNVFLGKPIATRR